MILLGNNLFCVPSYKKNVLKLPDIVQIHRQDQVEFYCCCLLKKDLHDAEAKVSSAKQKGFPYKM